MGFLVGDRVVKNPRGWRSSEFDSRGVGVGVGNVASVTALFGGEAAILGTSGIIGVRWPAGQCYHREDELLPAPIGS
jgi:hypothetical protein